MVTICTTKDNFFRATEDFSNKVILIPILRNVFNVNRLSKCLNDIHNIVTCHISYLKIKSRAYIFP